MVIRLGIHQEGSGGIETERNKGCKMAWQDCVTLFFIKGLSEESEGSEESEYSEYSEKSE